MSASSSRWKVFIHIDDLDVLSRDDGGIYEAEQWLDEKGLSEEAQAVRDVRASARSLSEALSKLEPILTDVARAIGRDDGEEDAIRYIKSRRGEKGSQS